MNWLRICDEARELGADEVAALEERLAQDGNDVEARVKLVGALFPDLTPERAARRGRHLVWIATHRPDISLSGFGTLVEDYAPAEHAALIAAWRATVARADVTTTILDNAAGFLGFEAPAEGEALYRRAIALEPTVAKWHERAARVLFLQAVDEEEAEARRSLASASVAELDAASALASNDEQLFGIHIASLDPLVLAERWDRASKTAERVLVDNQWYLRSWQYGNAIHHAEITLGWCAHARGDLAAAGEHLLRAGATPGSPQLNSFGPDFDLARVLFRAGAKSVVREYLVRCKAFWESGRRDLDRWLAALDRGDETDFERDYSE